MSTRIRIVLDKIADMKILRDGKIFVAAMCRQVNDNDVIESKVTLVSCCHNRI